MVTGDKSLSSYAPTEGVALDDRNSSIRVEVSDASAAPRSYPRDGQEISHLLMLGNSARARGTVSEEDSAGPGSLPRLELALHEGVKSSLHTESAKQVCSCLWLLGLPVVTGHGIVCYSGFCGI